MRYAIISDIHANAGALQSVIATCRGLGVDKIINLGDTVGYGARPNDCCQMLIEHGVSSIAGNHDLAACGVFEPVYFKFHARHRMLWTRMVLAEAHKQYLQALPQAQVIDGAFVIVHGSLKSYSQYLLTEKAIGQSFDLLKKNYPALQLCFFGHTHRAVAHELNTAGRRDIETLQFKLNCGSWYLINPGSIGYPRYTDSPLSFAIYDSDNKTIRITRLPEQSAAPWCQDMHPHIVLDAALLRQYGLFLAKAGARFFRNRFFTD